jgi:hypothetical protein
MTRPTDEYRDCYEAGLTVLQTAAKRGVAITSVYEWARRHNVVFSKEVIPIVVRPRVKVRAPTMAQLTKYIKDNERSEL